MKLSSLLLFGIVFTSSAFAQTFSEINKVIATDPSMGDQFGISTSISGNLAVVGAYRNFDAAFESGSAYVYYRDTISGDWLFMQKLSASDGAAEDWFGWPVSIDSNRIVVGAGKKDESGVDAGAAYVFELIGTTWNETAKLAASDGQADDRFGGAVAISGDHIVVGAGGDDDNGSNSGSVYVFEFDGVNWIEQVKLYAATPSNDDWFGTRLDISEDAFIVGVPNDDEVGNGAGAIYIFEKSAGVWSETVKLAPPDLDPYDAFGYSVAISGDKAIAGAYEKDEPWTFTGAAYMFYNTGTTWQQGQKLLASDKAEGDRFGWSVSISGNNAIVGASRKDAAGKLSSGGVYIYTQSGTWSETHVISASDADHSDSFGYSVDISGDQAVVGAIGDQPSGSLSGSAYFFGEPIFDDTGISDLDEMIDVWIFPNPTNEDELNIDLPPGDQISIRITDVNGSVVSDQVVIGGQVKIIPFDVIPGFYYIRMMNGNSVNMQKLIKN